ncbi:thymidine kinase, cytosolic isoform X2 [Halyomorpha halys]|uniref:thymidine kinase, cytosolic isoform X2 n=1 Tax=Halyomorpha halys TaxID=286706 RepID=UPI0006D4F33A|nr:thymidine kinase, cytosolic-like isoform X2 [Halyomorpha halys]
MVILGPLFSGKTSDLIRRIQRYHLACYRCVIIKHSNVDQICSTTSVKSHDGHSLPAILAPNLHDVKDAIKDFDVIGIDEGHLFPDLVSFCQEQSDNGKKVIVAALDSCGETVFKNALQLIPLSESVTKLTAICMSCANEATFSKAVPGDKEVFGSQPKLMSVCGDCYLKTNHSWRSPFQKYLSKDSNSPLVSGSCNS